MIKNFCLLCVFGLVTSIFSISAQAQCVCVCEFAKAKQIILMEKQSASGGTMYSFRPNFFRDCTGQYCLFKGVDYTWTISPTSTATYTVEGGTGSFQLAVIVTGPGKLDLSCTVSVTCGDGTPCSDEGTRSFHVR